MLPLKHVKQESPYGCTAASVAMVLGLTYAEVASMTHVDLTKGGMQLEDWCPLLFKHGFAYHRKYAVTQLKGYNYREPVWPPEPFAPVHLCSVLTSEAHAVVMDFQGNILDPNLDPAKTANSKIYELYPKVYFVLGLYRISY